MKPDGLERVIRSLRLLAAIAALAVGSSCAFIEPGHSPASPPRTQGFTFALIGDLGYFRHEQRQADNLFADLNRKSALAFVVHTGDLSSPRFACTNAFLSYRLAQFRASIHPLVYTPGDNDWTDCHGPRITGENPSQRLDKLREMFFQGDRTVGRRTLALNRQSQSANPAFAKYRENVRWDFGGVTFLTLHVVGSNNGRGRTPGGDAEYEERNRANRAWLEEGFAHAKSVKSRAIMIVQQANLFPEFPPFPGTVKEPSGLSDIRAKLQNETAAFGKPVVLVHGDSHFFRIDKPLSPRRVRGRFADPAFENFTRVETFGTPYHHWLEVTVDANDPGVFSFRPRIVPSTRAPPS